MKSQIGLRILLGFLLVSAAAGLVLATRLEPASPHKNSLAAVSPAVEAGVCIDTSLLGTNPFWDVTVEGNLAYVAQSRGGLAVYDISLPGSPVLLDTYVTPGLVYDVKVRGAYAYLADADWSVNDRGVTVVNISDPENLQFAGLNNQPAFAINLELQDTLLFVAETTVPGKLWIMSLSNPAVPAVIGTYSTTQNLRGVFVRDTLAYLAVAQGGLVILNVANPTLPVLVGAFSGLSEAYDIEVQDTVAYVANGSYGLALVNVSNPAAPVLLSSFDTPGWANDVEVVGGFAHVADVLGGYLIIDVSLPMNPHLFEAVPSVDRMLGLDVQGTRTYGADDTSFTIFAIGGLGLCGDGVVGPCEACDDGNYIRGDGCGDCLPEPQIKVCPVAAFETPGTANGMALRDSLLFVADGESGLQIYNTRYSGPPVHLGGYNTPGSARRVDVEGNLAAVADRSGGLRLIDVSDPTQPIFLGHFATSTEALDVQLVDTLAYVSCTDYFHVVKIALPSAPASVRSLYGTGSGLGIEVAGNRAYLAGGSTGLFIVDISNPASAAVIGNYTTGSIAKDVDVKGDTVYVANHSAGVMTLLVFPSGSSTVIDILPIDRAEAVVRLGGILYVSNYSSGIQLYDVSTATEPIQVGFVQHYSTFGLLVDAGRVYSVAQNGVAVTTLAIQGEHWCGNGTLEPGEFCDDSNFVSGDGCDSCCQLQAPMAVCGNGQVEYPEECDDDNTLAGDGCDPACLREPAVCGNGVPEYPEECDDGNADPSDGCNNLCGLGPICGDGTVVLPEECDDSNQVSGDGCDAFCQYEHTCGDGVLELGEECDDGNTDPRDGCSADCRIERCLILLPGDVNSSHAVTSADIIFIVNYAFKGGPTPLPCAANGDVNCSGAVTSGDIINLVNYVFLRASICDICKNSPLAANCLN